jgi:hypothetical protein
MSFSSPRFPSRDRRWISSLCVTRGLLVAALTSPALLAGAPTKPSRPYLATSLSPGLRFAPPAPEIYVEPTPTAPPFPDGIIGEIAQSNAEAVAPVDGSPTSAGSAEPPADALAETTPLPGESSVAPSPQRSRPPVELLPDDLPRRATPEDILPFFLPPLLPSAPPSSATYRQR